MPTGGAPYGTPSHCLTSGTSGSTKPVKVPALVLAVRSWPGGPRPLRGVATAPENAREARRVETMCIVDFFSTENWRVALQAVIDG